MSSNLNKYTTIRGFILPVTIVMLAASMGIIIGYYGWLKHKTDALEYRIAVAKATFNAGSGIADFIYPMIVLKEWNSDSLNVNIEVSLDTTMYLFNEEIGIVLESEEDIRDFADFLFSKIKMKYWHSDKVPTYH